jgi:hypothetical protein
MEQPKTITIKVLTDDDANGVDDLNDTYSDKRFFKVGEPVLFRGPRGGYVLGVIRADTNHLGKKIMVLRSYVGGDKDDTEIGG